MALLGQEEQLRELQDRFRVLNAIVLLGLGLLVSRLVYLQILQGDKMRNFSEENRIKRVQIPAPRGMIFDRNRKLLVDNRPSFDLEITPQYLKESKREREVLQRVAELIEMPFDDIQDKLEKAKGQQPFLPVKIKIDLNRDEVARVESWKLDLPGVAIQTEIERTNVYDDVASHLLGYIGKISPSEYNRVREKRYKPEDNIGKFGIEKQMESTLRGVDGEELIEVDAVGRRISSQKRKGRGFFENSIKETIPGKNLILTIDQDLQEAAVRAFGDKVGGLVAMNPKTGEILAMISRPSFNPTEFSRMISPKLWQEIINNPDRPLRDKTIQDHYPPGSTFKVFSAIAGLKEGVVTLSTKVTCNGKIKVGNREYHCHKKHGHGEVDLIQAISQSCDVYFYRLAQKLKSVDQLAAWANEFGLGKKTGVNLPREVAGLVPTEKWKEKVVGQPWQAGESLSVVIGQSFVLSTVMQLANAYAAIANGGTLYRPIYIRSIETPEGEVIQDFKPEVIREINVAPEVLQAVRKGLWGVINSPRGTAFLQRLPGMGFSGKTGTSQVARRTADKIFQKCSEIKYRLRHHGLFVGFAPMEDPEIVVAVLAEHACSGSGGAAPIAKEVVKTYLTKLHPERFTPELIAEAAKREAKEFVGIPRPSTPSDAASDDPEEPALSEPPVPLVPQSPDPEGAF